MTCPRCGGVLTSLTLGDARAVHCEECAYVGLPADHRSPGGESDESWERALERFYRDETGGAGDDGRTS